jgi:hypothetical protein
MANSLADIQRFIDTNGIEGLDEQNQAAVLELINRGDLRQPQQGESSLTEKVIGGGQVALNLVGGAAGRVTGGFLSLGPLVTKGPAAAEETLREVQDAFTFLPGSREGEEQLQAAGEFLSTPLGEVPLVGGLLPESIQRQSFGETTEQFAEFVGGTIRDFTGSDVMGSIAKAFPEVLATLLPTKFIPKSTSSAAKQAGAVKILKEARKKKAAAVAKIPEGIKKISPTVKEWKDISSALYREADALGVRLKPQALNEYIDQTIKMADDLNVDPVLSPKANRVLRRMTKMRDQTLTTKQVDKLRRLAQEAARNLGNDLDRLIGSRMVQGIDDLLIDQKKLLVPDGVDGTQLATKLEAARKSWGNGKRGDLIEDAMLRAIEAPNFEQGLRAEFGKLLRNPKVSRGFTDAEKAVIRRVSRGTFKGNIVKALGQMGFDFSKGGAFGGIGGIVAGGSLGGGPGAVILPFIGTVAKPFAERMTKGNADFASAVIRAGRDADLIIAAYLKNTPKRLLSSTDLGDILVNKGQVSAKLLNKEFIRDAARLAAQKQVALEEAISATSLAAEQEFASQGQQNTQPQGVQ